MQAMQPKGTTGRAGQGSRRLPCNMKHACATHQYVYGCVWRGMQADGCVCRAGHGVGEGGNKHAAQNPLTTVLLA